MARQPHCTEGFMVMTGVSYDIDDSENFGIYIGGNQFIDMAFITIDELKELIKEAEELKQRFDEYEPKV
jgi:hypothetical protein